MLTRPNGPGAAGSEAAKTIAGGDPAMDIDQAMKTAVTHHRANRLQMAEALCRNILAVRPRHADSLHLLGVIAYQMGNLAQALGLIGQAVHLNAHKMNYHNSLGNVYMEQGKWDAAIVCYQRVHQAAPGSVGILNNLGHAHEAKGEPDKAIFYYRKALQLKPDYAPAHYTLGNAFKNAGKLEQALACYQRALQIKPDFGEAQNNMGNAYYELGDLDNAIASYQKALRIKPEDSDACNNLANALKDQGKLDEAMSNYQKAIAINSNNTEAYNNLGIAFKDLGKLDEALTCFQKALYINPELIEVHHNMGVSFKDLGRLDEALSCYQKALQLRPDSGIQLKAALMLPVVCDSSASIQSIREKIDQRIDLMKSKPLAIDDPFKQIGTTNFYLTYHGMNNRHLQEKIASLYIHHCPQLVWEPADTPVKQRRPTKIQIGIISKFLHAHTIGRLNHGIVQHLDRHKFSVTVLRMPGPKDRISEAIDQSADRVVMLPCRWIPARRKIAEQRLDILFYTDIGMDPLTYFLAFSRLAPVQCTSWGHPDTTGIPNMDYYISSAAAEPMGAQNHYSEQLVLLSKFAMYCHRRPAAQKILSKRELGLAEDCHLYACVQSVFKAHPDFDHVLGIILRRDPKALIVFFEAKYGHWTRLLRKRLQRTLPDVHHRILFLKRLPEKDFQAFLPIADVLLDTPHFSGGYTSLLSLAGGVPIVTRPREFMRGRLTYAFYRQMGVMDCVADDDDAYAAIALRLAHDSAWNKALRAKIRARARVLFDDLQPVRELEFFFEWAHKAHRKATT